MNPADLQHLGLKDGQKVTIESARASISCVAMEDPTVRTGCVSLPHSWGTNPDEKEDPLGDYDKRTGIPIMSAIPINVRVYEEVEPAE